MVNFNIIYKNEMKIYFQESFSSRPIWWHYLCITVPNKLTRPNVGFLLVDQGNNNNG
jgi:hypothetical protein